MYVISRSFLSGALQAASNPKALFASGICSAALLAAPVAHSAVLNISVWDNGVLVGMAPPSTFGVATFLSTDPSFSAIAVRANGPLLLPGGDLSSVTLDISARAGFTGTHTITVDVFQTGISVSPGSRTETTLSVNNLINVPGPSTLSDYVNGTSSTLGTLLNTDTFVAGVKVSAPGPLLATVGPAITADAAQYLITFTKPDQSANDTIQFTTGIPEPSTWAMMLLGFAGLGYVAHRRARAGRPTFLA